MLEMRFGKCFIADGDTIPQLEVIIMEDGVEKRKNYLAPFRGYCFQVSATVDGQCDMGSSHVMSLYSIVDNADKPEDAGEMLSALAITALLKRAHYIDFSDQHDAIMVPYVSYNAGKYRGNKLNQEFAKFIDLTISWIVTREFKNR